MNKNASDTIYSIIIGIAITKLITKSIEYFEVTDSKLFFLIIATYVLFNSIRYLYGNIEANSFLFKFNADKWYKKIITIPIQYMGFLQMIILVILVLYLIPEDQTSFYNYYDFFIQNKVYIFTFFIALTVVELLWILILYANEDNFSDGSKDQDDLKDKIIGWLYSALIELSIIFLFAVFVFCFKTNNFIIYVFLIILYISLILEVSGFYRGWFKNKA